MSKRCEAVLHIPFLYNPCITIIFEPFAMYKYLTLEWNIFYTSYRSVLLYNNITGDYRYYVFLTDYYYQRVLYSLGLILICSWENNFIQTIPLRLRLKVSQSTFHIYYAAITNCIRKSKRNTIAGQIKYNNQMRLKVNLGSNQVRVA